MNKNNIEKLTNLTLRNAYELTKLTESNRILGVLLTNIENQISFINTLKFKDTRDTFFFQSIVSNSEKTPTLVTEELAVESCNYYYNYIKDDYIIRQLTNETYQNSSSSIANLEKLAIREAMQNLLNYFLRS